MERKPGGQRAASRLRVAARKPAAARQRKKRQRTKVFMSKILQGFDGLASVSVSVVVGGIVISTSGVAASGTEVGETRKMRGSGGSGL